MIERLTLTNFQCHERKEIDLDSRITTIVGRSDIGKSAILRALRWVCLNRPGGESFIRTDTTAGCGATVVSDGRPIIRYRKGSENTYRVDESTFRAFGTGVPDEVTNLLRVSEVNFQGQHEAPFWFLKSPGEVSQKLNAVVNLDLIDRTLTAISSTVRKGKAEVEVTKTRLGEARERRGQLVWVRDADEALDTLERLEGDLNNVQGKIRGAEDCLRRLREAEETLSHTIPRDAFDRIDSLFRELHDTIVKRRSAESCLAELQRQEQELCKANEDWTRLRSDLDKLSKDRCPLCGRKNP